MKLKLKEIIWEITGKCQNGCTYCGSKKNWKEEVDSIRIKRIADKIAEYPPEEIDISGGDPLLVPIETHKYVCDLLSKKNVKCKILINPKSFKDKPSGIKDNHVNILQLYHHIGVSVNTLEELEEFKKLRLLIPEKITIITNYNITNFFLHDKIADVLKGTNTTWQIQFTMYKDEKDPFAIYNYPEAIETLNTSISKYQDIHYIFADNANSGPCTAGILSIGILSNGDVIPCLSMRAWEDDVKLTIEGNILVTPLKDIWMTKFQKNRFDETCICCKDICKKQILTGSNEVFKILKEKLEDLKNNIPTETIQPQPIYGIQTQPQPSLPPLQQPFYPYPTPSVMAYAVFTSGLGNSGTSFQIKEGETISILHDFENHPK